jgi:hypothetical protein
MQSGPPHPTSWRSSHLCLGFPSGLLFSYLPTTTLYAPLFISHMLYAYVEKNVQTTCLILSKFRSQFCVIYSVQQPKHVAVISLQQ